MTSLAYLVFTFLACILGAGLGLFLHRTRHARRAAEGLAGPELVDGDEEKTYEAISRWQAHENRVFAGWVAACAASPVIAAVAGWGSRDQVVGTICSSLNNAAISTPLCF
jgi:hypothetical protein